MSWKDALDTALGDAVIPIADSKEDHEHWLATRMAHVTASDIAAACGLNPHKSRKSLLHDKVSQVSKNLDHIPAIQSGRFLEGGIFNWFKYVADFQDGECTSKLYWNPEYPHIAATPDGYVYDKARGLFAVEVKNTGKKSWGEPPRKWPCPFPPPAGVPAHYWVQHQIQMAVTNVEQGYIAGCLGGTRLDYHMFRLERDFVAWANEQVNTFWDDVLFLRETE